MSSNIEIYSEPLHNLFVLQSDIFQDKRGEFHKIFNNHQLENLGLETTLHEIYYSVNKKHVIRGMHFQIPPFDHNKIVWISQGKIKDVVLDIRLNSPSYGKYFSIELNSYDGKFIYIPTGFAHGFISLEDNTIVNYAQSSCHEPSSDSGILYNSFGMDWGEINPIISDRDLNFVQFNEFITPFK